MEILIIIAAIAPYLRLALLNPPVLFDGQGVLRSAQDPGSFWKSLNYPKAISREWARFNLKIFGDRMGGWILSTAILHALISVTVFHIASLFFGELPAMITALAYALHPTALSAVVLLEGHSSVLAGFFMTLSLYFALQGMVLAAVLCFMPALWSKISALMFIPFLLVVALGLLWR